MTCGLGRISVETPYHGVWALWVRRLSFLVSIYVRHGDDLPKNAMSWSLGICTRLPTIALITGVSNLSLAVRPTRI